MPGLTDSAISSLAQVYLRSDSPDVTANIQTWINLTQLKVCTAARWRFTLVKDTLSVTIATGSGPYTLSKNMVFPARVTSSYPGLDAVPFDQTQLYSNMAPGAPKGFTPVPGVLTQVNIYPAPDATYSIPFAYHSPLADLPFTGTQNYLCIVFPMILVAGACMEGFFYLGAQADIQQWRERLYTELNLLAMADLEGIEAATFSQTILPRLVNSFGSAQPGGTARGGGG
jgi:hypothetical protein